MDSLSVNFVLSASISFTDAEVVVLVPARTEGLVEAVDPVVADSLFFASVVAELDVEVDEAGFATVGRAAELLVLADSLEVVLLDAVLLAAFGLVKVLEVVGLRTVLVDDGAPRFSARLSAFAGGL